MLSGNRLMIANRDALDACRKQAARAKKAVRCMIQVKDWSGTNAQMLLVGIRSKRHLCNELHLNFCVSLALSARSDGPVPDHSNFLRTRTVAFAP